MEVYNYRDKGMQSSPVVTAVPAGCYETGGAEEQKVTEVLHTTVERVPGRVCGQLCVSPAIATACHYCWSLHTVGVHEQHEN